MGRTPRVLSAGDVVGMLDGATGAYVHVPFCTRICPFCPYNKVVPRPGQPTAYFDALSREVDAYVESGAAGSGGFTSLYVGGGTPTLFPRELAALLPRLPVAGERAIEVLPTHATPEGLDELRAMGFTAVSIGAQSFHDGVLHRLRRPHDARTARAAVLAAVGRFALVDVDLIVDVELDDHLAGAFLRDLTECFELGVDQVSTYPLMRFGYTPFGSTRHDRHREHEVLAGATRIAAEHGYERRSFWTFNRR
jgi:oxygen-independent coproporphyrinogen-3 oxidase